MTIDFAYKLVQFIVNKSQQGYISPADFNIVMNQAQIEYLDFLLGEFQQYVPGRPQPRIGFGQNSVIRQRLSPVIYQTHLDIDPASGHSMYPYDYQQTDAMWSYYGNDRIRYVQQDHLYSYYNSTIDPVASNPIYLIEDTGFRFYPTSMWRARLSYVRTPPNVNWAYIYGYLYGEETEPIYDKGNSIDPVWMDTDMLEIIAIALRIIGVNLRSPEIAQYANEVKQLG